jgi:hypothetical protein
MGQDMHSPAQAGQPNAAPEWQAESLGWLDRELEAACHLERCIRSANSQQVASAHTIGTDMTITASAISLTLCCQINTQRCKRFYNLFTAQSSEDNCMGSESIGLLK